MDREFGCRRECATKGIEIMKRRKIYYRDWHKKAKPENVHDLRRRIEELDRMLQQLAFHRSISSQPSNKGVRLPEGKTGIAIAPLQTRQVAWRVH